MSKSYTCQQAIELLGLRHPRSLSDLVSRGAIKRAEGSNTLDWKHGTACIDGPSVEAYASARGLRGDARKGVPTSHGVPKQATPEAVTKPAVKKATAKKATAKKAAK